jgi:DNA-binding transcriptional LysR family regulator
MAKKIEIDVKNMAKKTKKARVKKVAKAESARMDSFFNLADVQVAITIKNTMGLAKAAAFLDIPRPTLMAAIMRIERKLDGQLFYRKQGSGEVIVTEYGKVALPHLERMLWIYDELQTNKHFGENRRDAGSFGIVATQTILECFMAPYAVNFINTHPLIKLTMKQNDNLLAESQKVNDIFIGSSTGDSDQFTYIPFHTFYQKLWASRQYLEAYGRPAELKDLKSHRLLMHKNTNENQKSKHAFYFDTFTTQLYPYLEQNNIIDIAGLRLADVLAEKGLGIMIASEETVALSNLKLERVLPDVVGDVIELFLRIDKTFAETPIAKYAIDWIFKCRDQALGSINVEPTMNYTPFYNESSPS